MLKYIFRRILYIILIMFLITSVIFFIYRTMPGDPVDIYLPPELAFAMNPYELEAQRAEIIRTLGLDQPHHIQYFLWLGQMLRGNFGISMQTRTPVVEHIRGPMARTMIMSFVTMVIIFAITIPAGIYSAVKRGKLFDKSALVGSMIGLSIPTFLFALILIVIFSVILGWLPIMGLEPPMPPDRGTLAWFMARVRHMVLPVMALVLTGMAGLIRYTRSAMIDSLNMDCIRTARSKGLAEKTVIYVHALRNAMILMITVMAGWIIGIFGGSLVIEITFAWNGMGLVMFQALNTRDIGVLMTMTVFYSSISFTGVLLMDIAYVIADPRIRFE